MCLCPAMVLDTWKDHESPLGNKNQWKFRRQYFLGRLLDYLYSALQLRYEYRKSASLMAVLSASELRANPSLQQPEISFVTATVMAVELWCGQELCRNPLHVLPERDILICFVTIHTLHRRLHKKRERRGVLNIFSHMIVAKCIFPVMKSIP